MRLSEPAWAVPPEVLALPEDELHVWLGRLDLPSPQLANLRRLLSADEEERASRFHTPGGRDHYVAARGLLRTILARYLRIAPELVRFSYGSHGKPLLAPPLGPSRVGEGAYPGGIAGPVQFNTSHAGALAAYVVARRARAGVDVELVRENAEHTSLAERFFSDPEQAWLAAVPTAERSPAFFVCWTAKEAYIKAKGRGLSYPLSHFDVSALAQDPTGSGRLAPLVDPHDLTEWGLYAFAPCPGYVAAVAAEGRTFRLSFWLAGSLPLSE